MTNARLLVASVIFALLGVVLLSCGDRGSAGGVQGGPALDRTYVVTGITEAGVQRAAVAGSEIRLRFDAGRLSVSAGCNTMGGAYTWDGTRLTVSDLSMTEMGCSAPLMEQDAWVAGLFGRPVQFTAGSEPTVISGDVVLTLADREQVSPDLPVLGTLWTLDGIGSGGAQGAVTSVPEGVVATVRFASDGTALVYDGCNGGSGPATIDGDTISWGERVLGGRACSDPLVGTVSSVMQTVLSGITTFTLQEKTLVITQGERSLAFRAE